MLNTSLSQFKQKHQRKKNKKLFHAKKSDLTNETDKLIENEYLEDRIHAAINTLPLHIKTVIILRDIQELSYDDISNIVGVPLGTIKSRINRARLQLQADLQDLK